MDTRDAPPRVAGVRYSGPRIVLGLGIRGPEYRTGVLKQIESHAGFPPRSFAGSLR